VVQHYNLVHAGEAVEVVRDQQGLPGQRWR
jgi:hypothetical protein